MGLLYDRKETKETIVITYKYWALFYLFLLAVIILSFVFPRDLTLVSPLIILISIGFIIGIWKPNREIRKAMKQGKIEITGNKFSFSKPFTAIIKK